MSIKSFLEKYPIPEPTRSLLWITDEDISKISNPNVISIVISMDASTGNVISKEKHNEESQNLHTEPSLVWTKLPVEENHETLEKEYVFSYAEFNRKKRYQYIKWLQDITQLTENQYINLYLKGLERHLILGKYDDAVDELIKLWEHHENESLKYYIPQMLAFASVIKKRPDILEKAPFLLTVASNPVFNLQLQRGIEINAKQVMDSAHAVGFKGIYYLKKYTAVFEELIQKQIDKYVQENGAILSCASKSITDYRYTYHNNSSIPSELMEFEGQNYLYNPVIQFILLSLLDGAYEDYEDNKKSKQNKKGKLPHKKRSSNTFKGRIAMDGNIAKERLPYPYIYYPSPYGIFFGFKKDLKDQMYFCSCSQKAIKNYIRLRTQQSRGVYLDPEKEFIISSRQFPSEFVKALLANQVKDDQHVYDHFIFEEKLCHECNKATPSLLYTHPMYGGLFKQKFGWYIGKTAFELGIQLEYETSYLEDVCPPDLIELIQERKTVHDELMKVANQVGRSDNLFAMQAEMVKENRRLETVIENLTREKFGYKKVGEAWTSETTLFNIVKKLLPTMKITHHYKPDYLKGMEFDIYVHDLNLAIEYQGIQHYQAVDHWGGEESLQKLQERDRKKNQIANDQSIPLIYFNYDEDLTEHSVVRKLGAYIVPRANS